jgi:hypothetical protein
MGGGFLSHLHGLEGLTIFSEKRRKTEKGRTDWKIQEKLENVAIGVDRGGFRRRRKDRQLGWITSRRKDLDLN